MRRGSNQTFSETVPLTPPIDGPSTSGINKNYGSFVSLLKKKLSLASFHSQVNCYRLSTGIHVQIKHNTCFYSAKKIKLFCGLDIKIISITKSTLTHTHTQLQLLSWLNICVKLINRRSVDTLIFFLIAKFSMSECN